MDEEQKLELIKEALRWHVGDIDALHEATGLFLHETVRKNKFTDSLFSRQGAKLNTTPYGLALSKMSLFVSEDEFDDEAIQAIKDLHVKLVACSIKELEQEVERLRQQNIDQKEQDRLFNCQEHRLKKLPHWIRKSIWTPKEALLLLCDREPSDELIRYIDNLSDWDRAESSFAQAFEVVMDIMQTALASGEISQPGKPLEYLHWFDKVKFDVPDELRSGILEIHGERKPAVHKSDLSKGEKHTLLKLIAAMATGGYGFDPTKQRSTQIKQIQNDLEHLGLTMDEKTIRKWVRKSCQLIDND
jgi:hypothetical protein